jgi:ribose 5-phosphate isomerase B
MKIAIGGDHAGFTLKVILTEYLRKKGHDVLDCGSFDPNPVDFPDIAGKLCQEVRNGSVDRGLMVCGTGVGASIAANKIPGIRAAVCHDIYSAHQCVEHDDVNVMCIGAQIVGSTLAMELLEAFLTAEFSTAPEFRRRVEKLHEMDKKKYNEGVVGSGKNSI